MIIGFLMLLGTFNAHGQTKTARINSPEVLEIIDSLEVYQTFMGSIDLRHAGEVEFSRAIGYTSIADSLLADTQTQYRIGSISKIYTATMVMKLVEKGVLGLDDRLSRYFPDFPKGEQITIRQLMSHRTGIGNITGGDYFSWCTQKTSPDTLMARIVALDFEFEPGSDFSYSNSNFILLYFIIESATSKSYEQVLADFITEPLGLRRTKVGGRIDRGSNQAFSYSYQDDWVLSVETDMSIPLGAGNIISTPHETSIFLEALMRGEIVSQESLDQMLIMSDSYGLGIIKSRFANKKCYGHSGGIDDFTSQSFYFPDDSLCMTVFSNGIRVPLNDVALNLLSAIYGMDVYYDSFKPIKPPNVEATVLQSYAGIYATSAMPLKIEVTTEIGRLYAQATGQPKFELEHVSGDEFRFRAAGLTLTFVPAEDKATLRQGGGVFTFSKEE